MIKKYAALISAFVVACFVAFLAFIVWLAMYKPLVLTLAVMFLVAMFVIYFILSALCGLYKMIYNSLT